MIAERRQMHAVAHVENRILGALLRTEYRHLIGGLEHVELKRGAILYRAEQKIEHVYFPEDAVVAMVDTMANGRTVEVGVIGVEGLVGINIFLGGVTTPDKAVVQIAGGAMRMKSRDLRREMRFGSALQRLLLRYTQAFLAVISQSVACCEHHSVEQRIARWVLTMQEYSPGRELEMSHQNIAAMLGSRRSGVSVIAANFRRLGLISYRRGRIRVLDKAGLERRACECYRFNKRQFAGWRGQVPRLLSGEGSPAQPVAARKKRA
ncbi:MAG TPA: Crp/Fnr family transcriptional regulator [Burkholderiales bacterium]